MTKANYEILVVNDDIVIIKDVGPWDQFMTITNDAEGVVEDLAQKGFLSRPRRLMYYDSENQCDEIVHKDGKFVGFKPGGSP